MSGIFIDSIHVMKPLIYKFPQTFFFLQRAPPAAVSPPPLSCECVLRYTALFIKGGAEPNELLTGARLSISRLKECSVISRLLAFFSSRDAIYSLGSVRAPTPPGMFSQSPFTLS